MASFLKNLDDSSKQIKNVVDESTVFTVAYNGEFTMSKIASVNDASFKTDGINSVWSLFDLYSQKKFDALNNTYADGGINDTVWQELISAYETNGMIMFQVDESNWRKSISAQNIEIKWPLNSSYSGATSGLSATTLYSSFIDEKSIRTKSTNSVCDPQIVDTLYSEPSVSFTDNFGIGYKYQVGDNPTNDSVQYQSGMVFLMSNDSNAWSGTPSGKSWSTLYNIPNKYTKGADLITPIGNDRDVASGVYFVNSGIGFIFDTDFVKGFNWAGATGGTGTTGVSFVGNEAYFNAADIDTKTTLQVDVILQTEDFTQSLNDSYREDSIENGTNCDVAYNTITFHDSAGRCLVYAKASEAIIKPEGDFSVITLDIPVDGNIQESLADTRGKLF
jgi:hypothetical protein